MKPLKDIEPKLRELEALARRKLLLFGIMWQNYKDAALSYRAAMLTFVSLLSLVPLMLVVLLILSALPGAENLAKEIQEYLFLHFVAGSASQIQDFLKDFLEDTSRVSGVGIFSIFFFAIYSMIEIEEAINAIWSLKARQKGFNLLVKYWAILTLGPLLLGVSIISSSYVFSLPYINEASNLLAPGKQAALQTLPFILSFLAFLFLYTIVPNCKIVFKHAVIGAGAAAIIFEVSKYLFALYYQVFPIYEVLYGALASIPIFILWVYLSWTIVLMGALLTHALSISSSAKGDLKLDGFMHAYLWVTYLFQAHKTGKSLSMQDLMHNDAYHYQHAPEVMIAKLIKQDFVSETSKGRYMLKRDLNNLTLADFYKTFPYKLPSSQKAPTNTEPERRLNACLIKTEKASKESISTLLIELMK